MDDVTGISGRGRQGGTEEILFFFFFRKFLNRETRLKKRARLSQVGERKEKAFQTSGKA